MEADRGPGPLAQSLGGKDSHDIPSASTLERCVPRSPLMAVQPLTLKAGVVFVIAGAALVLFFREERARVERKRIATATKGIGKPKVGGPFELVDTNGKPFSNEDMKDKYGLVCLPPVLRGAKCSSSTLATHTAPTSAPTNSTRCRR